MRIGNHWNWKQFIEKIKLKAGSLRKKATNSSLNSTKKKRENERKKEYISPMLGIKKWVTTTIRIDIKKISEFWKKFISL